MLWVLLVLGINICLPAFAGEPSVREVQRAAVRYAGLENEKFQSWRSKAAGKAWFPRLSVGIDYDTGDLWHWEGGSTTRQGDDILRKGKTSTEWDITLSWDLSDIVWNKDQTSIDTRYSIAVRIRQAVLARVTKLYYERQKARQKLETLENQGERKEQELQIEELTAMLDALTGGLFSQ
ncbi:MAG: TolC family protein [Candidatus Omnitrophica bacterium]|nr:TolC family protein [Candidatus Omnitrophota bacterium]